MHAVVLLYVGQCINLKCLASPIPKMSGAKFFKMGHATLTTLIRGQSVIPKLALDIIYLNTIFGDYHFSRS